jgi:hypothetical protein
MNISEVINKLLDNVNAGKVVTDVGPGLLLVMSVLMVVGLGTGMSVVPLSARNALAKHVAAQEQRNQEAEQEMCRALAQPAGTPPHRCVVAGAQRIARLNATLEAARQQIAADQKANRASAAPVLADQAAAQNQADPLMVLQTLVEESRASLAAAQAQFADATSFAFNLRVVGENLTQLLALAVILGVIVSQVSRYLFIDLLFDNLLELKDTVTPPEVAATKAFEELRTHYFRYVEGAINMALPLLAFGIMFPLYSHLQILEDASPWSLDTFAWIGGTLVTAIVLLLAAFDTYKSYTKKVRALTPAAPETPA